MNSRIRRVLPALSAFAASALFVSSSHAQCGAMRLIPQLLSNPAQLKQAVKMAPAVAEADAAFSAQDIVGLWHVKFIAKGNAGIPDGTEVDAGYAEWNFGGTEIMNSGSHAPNTSNFCLGTWQSAGNHLYRLNHFAISWDPSKGQPDASGQPSGELVGPARIQEEVALSRDSKTFGGTFTIDVYDESLNTLAHLVGVITATRIDVDTPASSIF